MADTKDVMGFDVNRNAESRYNSLSENREHYLSQKNNNAKTSQ